MRSVRALRACGCGGSRLTRSQWRAADRRLRRGCPSLVRSRRRGRMSPRARCRQVARCKPGRASRVRSTLLRVVPRPATCSWTRRWRRIAPQSSHSPQRRRPASAADHPQAHCHHARAIPASASDAPSIIPSAEAGAPKVEVDSDGHNAVGDLVARIGEQARATNAYNARTEPLLRTRSLLMRVRRHGLTTVDAGTVRRCV